jgi:hypothetical protein
MSSTLWIRRLEHEWKSDDAFRRPVPAGTTHPTSVTLVGARTIAAVRAVTLISAALAIVVGLWGAFGSPPDAWRTLGDYVIAPLLIGVLVIAYTDHRSTTPASGGAVADASEQA